MITLACPNPDTDAFLAQGPSAANIVQRSCTVQQSCTGIFPPPAYNLDDSLLEELNHLAPDAISSALDIQNLKKLTIIPFPAFLQSDLSDYIGRSPMESLEAVRKISGLALPMETKEEDVLGREFWSALIRGGYQGAVYHIDRLFLRKLS